MLQFLTSEGQSLLNLKLTQIPRSPGCLASLNMKGVCRLGTARSINQQQKSACFSLSRVVACEACLLPALQQRPLKKNLTFSHLKKGCWPQLFNPRSTAQLHPGLEYQEGTSR